MIKFDAKIYMPFVFLMVFAPCYSFAEPSAIQSVSVTDLSTIKTSYKAKEYHRVVDEGVKYLARHPKDVDVQLFVALSYYKLHEYTKAENNFESVLSVVPEYKEAILGLINTKMATKKYKEVLILAQKGLSYYPNDPALLAKEKAAKFFIEKRRAKPSSNTHRKKQNKQVTKIRISPGMSMPYQTPGIVTKPNVLNSGKSSDVESIRDVPHYEFNAYTSNANETNTNNTDSIWNWSTLSLYRKNEYGAIGGGVNYANRLGLDAPQAFINFIPKINKSLWLDLIYATANKPEIFPDDTVYGEAYALLGNAVEVSIGDSYKKIQNTYFNTFSGSITKYIGNYTLTFRPRHYVPKAGPTSTLYTVTARRFSDENVDKFIGVTVGSGRTPDLFDLLTVTFFNVEDNFVFIQGQQPITDEFLFSYGGGYETQKFPNNFIRRLAYFNIGLKLRFT